MAHLARTGTIGFSGNNNDTAELKVYVDRGFQRKPITRRPCRRCTPV